MFDTLTFLASGPIAAFSDSDAIGKVIVILQIFMSVISWAIMLNKNSILRALMKRSNYFVDLFVSQNDPLAIYYEGNYRFSDNPIEQIYAKTCERLAHLIPSQQRLLLRQDPTTPIHLTPARMELVESTCSHTLDESILKVNQGTMWLASITSLAPLLGLFGTVWGVMLAFQGMASSGHADIAELAPGISSALLTTVVGLVVAIPSTLFYNMLQSTIETYSVTMEGFSDELMGKLNLNYRKSENAC